MRKNFIILFIVVLILAACGSTSETESSEDAENSSKVTIKLGHNAPANSPTGKAAEKLAEIVEEKSDGNFIIDVHPDNQLGDNRDLLEQTSVGGLEMSMSGLGVLGYLADEYNFMQIPFIFRDQEHARKVAEGEIGTEIAETLKNQHNIELLSQSWDRLPRQISANKAIKTPDDLKDFLIRSGTKGATETFALLGAKPTSVPLDEVYLSLQNNIIEGVELPIDYMVSSSVAEVNSHLNITNHTYGTQFVAINLQVFEDLDTEYQEILTEAVKEAGDYNNQLTVEEEEEYLNQLIEAGMEVVELTDEEHAVFTEMVMENIDKLEETWPETKGLGERIIQVK